MIWNSKNGSVPVDGTEMDYVSFGYGKKILILLPGLSDGITTVKGKAVLLASSYKLFIKNYTVYIFSRKNNLPENYSIRNMADDQAKAMHSLGIGNASVLGASEGGMIAMHLAIGYPELVDKLVLAVTASRISESARATVLLWKDYARAGDYAKLMADTAEKSYSETYLRRYRKLLPLLGLFGRPASYNRFLANANAILNFDCYDELRSIKRPTLIICGKEDRIVGAEASLEMHRKIQGSRIYMYEGLGHALYEEAKRDFDRRVLNFLDSES